MFELVHLTDLHIARSTETTLRGIDTRASLDAVYERILACHGAPQAILLTGDIADDGSREAYEHIREVFAPAPCPVLAIPGNHDHPETLREVLCDAPFVTEGTHALGAHWCVHLLDSHVAGEVGGRLRDEAVARLPAPGSVADGVHHLIALHHPPVPLGSAWMDDIGLAEPDALLRAVDGSPAIRAVLWGHAHQRFDAHRGNTHLMCTPSTCMQFAPKRDEFATDSTRGPGYRHLILGDGGDIETQVVWLPFNTGARTPQP